MARMTGGRALVESLKAHETDLLFGIISVHNLDFFDALYDSLDGIRYVGGRLELGCGYMADGYARASGRPGVLITSTGPGAADSMGAMGEAYHSGSPVLEITTNVEVEFLNSNKCVTHEPKDQLGMFRSVTDWNALVTDVESIPDHVQEAFHRFQTRRPRPIELEIATDLLGQEADVEVIPPREVTVPQGDPAMIERAAEALIKARRPVIWVGEEVLHNGGTEQVMKLADLLGAPVVSGDGGKGAFPEDHPLSLGQALGRRIWGENPVQDFIGTCDVALVMGSILPYRSTAGVGLGMPQTLIHILLDGEAIGKNYPTAMPIVANSKAALEQILSLIGDKDVHKGDSYVREIAELKSQTYESLKEQWPNELYTLEAMRSVLPRDTVTCWDPTVPTSRASRGFQTLEPRTFMHPHGWAGLGFAFPASLGAKLAKPESPVVCVTGDGGFQYNFQELGTAAQYGINPVVVMFNDSAWGVLKQRQQDNFNGRVIGTDLVNPDFVKLFDSYGFEGRRVSTVDELVSALSSAVKSDQLQFIEAQIPNGFANFR